MDDEWDIGINRVSFNVSPHETPTNALMLFDQNTKGIFYSSHSTADGISGGDQTPEGLSHNDGNLYTT